MSCLLFLGRLTIHSGLITNIRITQHTGTALYLPGYKVVVEHSRKEWNESLLSSELIPDKQTIDCQTREEAEGMVARIKEMMRTEDL